MFPTRHLWCIVLMMITLLQNTPAMRILAFFPIAAKSHHHVFQPILNELLNRGHVITYLSPFGLEQDHPNATHIQIDDYKAIFSNVGGDDMTSMTPFTAGIFYGKLIVKMGERMCSSKPLQEIFHSNQKFDMVLHEALFFQEYILAFIHKIGAVGVGVYPFGEVTWVNEMSGLPDNPSYMMGFQTPLTDRMNFLERLYATATQWAITAITYYHLQRLQPIVDRCFNYGDPSARPRLTQLASDQELVLIGSHHAVGYSFPKAPHVKEIGGITIKKNMPLPRDLENFINNSKRGVIYVSFGSLLRTELPAYRNFRKALLNSFGKLKENVLFKMNDAIEGFPENVLVDKWFPQQNVLAHKNIKLFISHGGHQSMVEMINYGVPAVIIPFFCDQYKNAKFAEIAGFGVGLDFKNVTEASISWAVREIIDNPRFRYKKEAQRRSRILNDRPMKPLDEAIYWIEYVQRHGKILQPTSVHQSLIQVNLLDVYSAAVGFLLVSFIVLRRLASWALHLTRLPNVSRYKKNV